MTLNCLHLGKWNVFSKYITGRFCFRDILAFALSKHYICFCSVLHQLRYFNWKWMYFCTGCSKGEVKQLLLISKVLWKLGRVAKLVRAKCSVEHTVYTIYKIEQIPFRSFFVLFLNIGFIVFKRTAFATYFWHRKGQIDQNSGLWKTEHCLISSMR